MVSNIIRTGSKLGKTAGKKASKARLKEVMSTIKTGLPPKFRKTVLGDADIQGTGAPQYERLKKTLGRDRAHEVINNLKKEFKREERKIRNKTYKSKEIKEQALERHYKQYGMQDNLPLNRNMGGKIMKNVPADNTGLAKLPTKVRNRMGYKQTGGKVTAGSTKKGSTRGTPSQGARAYESEKAQMKEFQDYMKYVDKQLSNNRGSKKRSRSIPKQFKKTPLDYLQNPKVYTRD